MKKYDSNTKKMFRMSINGLISSKIGCSHDTVNKTLYEGRGGKRETALYRKITNAADKLLEVINEL